MPAVRRHACPVEGCLTTLSRYADIKRHYDAVHIKEKRWSCPICNIAMKEKSNIKIHIKNVHYRIKTPSTKRRSRSSKSRKGFSPSTLAAEPERVETTPRIESCLGAFPVTESRPSSEEPCKVEEQPSPALSPSRSVSDSTSSPPRELVPCPAFGSDLPTAPLPAPSSSSDYYTAVSQAITPPRPTFASRPLELFSGLPLDINVARANQLPPIQDWNTSSPTFIPAYTLVNPLTDFQPEFQNFAPVDFGLSEAEAAAYLAANELSFGAQMLDASLEYQPAVVDVPAVYQNSRNASHDDLPAPSVNANDFFDVDFRYFDQNWNVSPSLDNLDASTYF